MIGGRRDDKLRLKVFILYLNNNNNFSRKCLL